VENYCGPSKAFQAPRLRHLPWLTLVRFGKWDEILAIREPATTNDFLVDRAMWHFCRGLALVAQQRPAGAEEQYKAMAKLASSEEAKKLSNPNFPVADTLAIPMHWLAGKVAGAKGDTAAMIGELEKALALETALPYMEPKYWPIPVRTALAAAYLRSGNAVKAEQTFREDLNLWPRNGWSLFGLERALREQGKKQQADDVQRQFADAWSHADVALDVAWY